MIFLSALGYVLFGFFIGFALAIYGCNFLIEDKDKKIRYLTGQLSPKDDNSN